MVGDESGEEGDDQCSGDGGLKLKVLPEGVWRGVGESGHDVGRAVFYTCCGAGDMALGRVGSYMQQMARASGFEWC